MNNSNNPMWNKRFGDRRQVKVGRAFNTGDKDFDNRRNRGDVWKKKGTQDGKGNGQMVNDKEKYGNKDNDGGGVRAGNKFDVLNNMEDNNEELEDMVTYFKKQLEINKLKEMEDANMDIEDVLENNSSIAKEVYVEEMEDITFGGWNWVSNSIHSSKGCRIIIGWDKSKIDLMVLHMTSQLMFVVIEIIKSKQKVFCCYVYASNSDAERRRLWDELRNIKAITNGCPCFLMGDFNVTLDVEEHSAGGSKINEDMHDFKDCINDIKVEDINSCGLFYTWIKSPSMPATSILKKLDRVMINTEFLDKYGDAYARFLPFLISDHSPVMLHIPNSLDKNKKSFRFSNFVANKPDFLEVVKKEWKLEVEANDLKEKLSQVLYDYNTTIDDEEKLLAQKAKVKWLSEGDKNTKYFHNVIKSRRNSNRIRGICDEQGNWFEGEDVVAQFVKHFEKFLGNNGEVEQIESPDDLFLNRISQDKAELMVREITNKEIKEAIFDIGNDKAPGPDGFTATFFKRSWDIVGEDVCDAVKEFFKSNKLLGEVNATLITLELLKGYNMKNGPKRCALKIDIAKAYDTVNWNFLNQSLVHFGFHEKMIDWIMTCVASVAFSLCVNGERHGYFKDGRGLRQGDPMSPYLFTLVMEEITISLNTIGDTSSLIPNINKSTILFGSVNEIDKRRILEVMPFSIGKLPIKYLVVPLITKSIGITECNQLVEKVKQKASVFLIPKTTVKDIDKVLKGFLWSQGELKKGAAKIAWKIVCTPKNKGGLGIKSLGPWNEALLCKHLWNVSSNKDSLWALLNLRSKVRNNILQKLGDGEDTNVWFDNWSNVGPICDIVPFRKRYEARLSERSSVADMLTNNEWNWPKEWKFQFKEISKIDIPKLKKDVKDNTVWRDGNGIEDLLLPLPYTTFGMKGIKGTTEQRNAQSLINGIIESLKMQLMSLNVKRSRNVKRISEEWNIKMLFWILQKELLSKRFRWIFKEGVVFAAFMMHAQWEEIPMWLQLNGMIWLSCGNDSWKAHANNDVNVIRQSPILNDLKDKKALEVPFVANGVTYKLRYYLTDGIYPESIPRKEKDPGSFTLSCYINNVCFDNVLADLGASVSVMPLLTYLNLGLGELAHTKLTVELADRTVKYPKGIAKNVLVGIGKFVFPVDFIILDMPEDIKVPLFLGRPFLSTAHAKIDVFKRKITLRLKRKTLYLSIIDLEARLMGETLVLNRSLDLLFGDYIELNDLNVPLELRRDQVDDLMPTIKECEVVDEFRTRNDARMVSRIFRYPNDYDYDKKIHISYPYNLKFSCMIDFAVLEDMDAYRDKGMGDVIFGEPFLKEVGINARRLKGMITIYNGHRCKEIDNVGEVSTI
ncbi:RNA-directed DNA polymerase, eukaryota, reverse transcriptase zinc-binding domain protein [Tanacetum coccineum]